MTFMDYAHVEYASQKYHRKQAENAAVIKPIEQLRKYVYRGRNTKRSSRVFS